MSAHSITTSVISLANPWLDFLPADTAATTARSINDEMSRICINHRGILYALGTLPLSAPVEDIVTEVERLATLEGIKGLILGTTGLGKGLDDEAMKPLWKAIEKAGLLIFLHPHYGLPEDVFGPRVKDSGHVLPLSLGFPMETTVAFTRMYLAGIFDVVPDLRILLAHAGGAVPFLAGRVDSCILHERALLNDIGEPKAGKSIWEVLKKNIWLDGVVYSKVGVQAAVEVVGKEKVLWGTDHPFFPPVGNEAKTEAKWKSVTMNIEAVKGAFAGDDEGAEAVLYDDEKRIKFRS